MSKRQILRWYLKSLFNQTLFPHILHCLTSPSLLNNDCGPLSHSVHSASCSATAQPPVGTGTDPVQSETVLIGCQQSQSSDVHLTWWIQQQCVLHVLNTITHITRQQLLNIKYRLYWFGFLDFFFLNCYAFITYNRSIKQGGYPCFIKMYVIQVFHTQRYL